MVGVHTAVPPGPIHGFSSLRNLASAVFLLLKRPLFVATVLLRRYHREVRAPILTG